MTGLDRRARRGGCRRIRLACRGDAGLAINGAAVRSGVPLDRQADRCAAIVALAVTVRVGVVSVFIARIAAGRARLGALMLRFAVRHPRTIGIAVVSIVIGRCAAAGTSLASAVLGIAVLAPRTGRIAMITVIRSAVSAGTAGCRSAMLTGRRIAPRSIAHTVAGIIIVRRAAVPARTSAPMLAGRILLPRAIAIVVSACIDGFALGLTAGARIASVTIAGTGRCLLALQHPCMAAAIRAGARPISTGSVALGSVCS